MKKGYLVFSDGTYVEGTRMGAEGETIGELVFTTGVVGYLETITDPSYAGQIITQTFPLIGNYGVIPEDFEGEPALKGYVVDEICSHPSNFRSQGELNDYLREKGIVALCGVDTRAITKKIREQGVVNAGIFNEVPADLTPIRNYKVGEIVPKVCTKKVYEEKSKEGKYKVALIDYGAKNNIVRSLLNLGCDVTIFPSSAKAEEILSGGFDGLMLSNGPGDPAENVQCIAEIKKMIGKIPTFGICLGHQLAALAMGGKTVKLKYGHRGGNQPVRSDSRVYITSQNHGYAVVAESLKGVAQEIFVNVNDGSSEGFFYPNKKCFTVQFHPEAASGPHDTGFLFDKFLQLMEGKEYASK